MVSKLKRFMLMSIRSNHVFENFSPSIPSNLRENISGYEKKNYEIGLETQWRHKY